MEKIELDSNEVVIPMFLGGDSDGGNSDPDDDGTGPDSDDYSEDSEP